MLYIQEAKTFVQLIEKITETRLLGPFHSESGTRCFLLDFHGGDTRPTEVKLHIHVTWNSC